MTKVRSQLSPSRRNSAMRSARLVLATCFILLGAEAQSMEREQVYGWISIRPVAGESDKVAIQAHASALTPIEGGYEMVLTKAAHGGRSKTRQSGAITLDAQEQRDLSRTIINLGPEDELEVELTISVEGHAVFSVSARTGAE